MTEELWNEQQRRCECITRNIARLREKAAQAALQSGREAHAVRVMAVTKTVAPVYINHAVSCGMNLIGENKVQELLAKQAELVPCEKQLIGHLQSNKVKSVLGAVSLIQSVDTPRLAAQISRIALQNGQTMPVLAEINIAGEQSKFGIDPAYLTETLHEIAENKGILLQGLMCVPPLDAEKEKLSAFFQKMHRLFLDIGAKKLDNIDMCILSMGMSDDFETAIHCGANLVRLGSAIFGDRIY